MQTRDQLLREMEQMRRRTAVAETAQAELEQTVQDLQKNLDRLTLALNFSQTGTWSLNVQEGTCTWDDYCSVLFGLRPGSFRGSYQGWLDLVHPDDRPRVQDERARCLEELTDCDLEYRVIWPDGSIHDITSKSKVHADQHGRATQMTGVCCDITRHKHAEKALRNAEERYRAVFEQAADTFVVVDSDTGAILEFNDRAHENLGYTREEFAKLKIGDFDAIQSVEEIQEIIQKVVAEGSHTFETKHRCKDGRIRDVLVSVKTLSLPGKRLIFVVGTDITDRKKADQALRRIQWLLTKGTTDRFPLEKRQQQPYGDLSQLNTNRLILDSVGTDILSDIARDFLGLLDTSTAIYEKNGDYALGIFASCWCQFLDKASRDLCGTDDNREALACGKWHCHESCWNEASKVAIETDRPVDVECHGGIRLYAVPIRAGGENVGAINFGYADPPNAPEKLREVAQRYGVPMDTLLEQARAYPFRPPFIIDIAKERLRTSARLIGEIVERKRAEEALRKARDELEQRVQQRTVELRKSEEKYRTLVETIPHGIQEINASGVITFGNTAYYTMLGYEPEEVLGRYVWDLLSDDLQKDQLRQYIKELFESQPPRTPYFQMNLTKHGEPIDVQVDWSYKRAETGAVQGFVSVITDITERRTAEEKLEAEGRLLRKLLDLQERERKLVAHEIHDGMVQDVVGAKMLLEGIVHNSENETQFRSDQIEQAKKPLDKAIAEGRRLIRELRPMVLDEAGIVEAIKHLVASECCDASLQVELRLPRKVSRLDSMLEGTLFRIVKEALTNVKRHSQSPTAVIKLVQKDQQLLLEIRDHGVGFDPEKVSETRFGLRGIRERARLFGGHAAIESAMGQGSCITVELPVVERVTAEASESGGQEDQERSSR